MVEREGQRREGGVRGMCVKKLGTQGFYKKLGQILKLAIKVIVSSMVRVKLN